MTSGDMQTALTASASQATIFSNGGTLPHSCVVELVHIYDDTCVRLALHRQTASRCKLTAHTLSTQQTGDYLSFYCSSGHSTCGRTEFCGQEEALDQLIVQSVGCWSLSRAINYPHFVSNDDDVTVWFMRLFGIDLV